MAAERVQDVPFVDDDDDDMPPLVDNPYPSMTFTFAANMTPITYSTDPNGFEVSPEITAPGSFIYSPPSSPIYTESRPSHNKKKDASYIPRPPNAFILFRSSFIRAQHIPEKIEGNHSALSKIIGKYWKALPREEREIWEAKAIVALAEHRKKYPDWRFRPGANALSKVKDGPRRRNNKKGKGEAEKKVRNREKRCDKIADLLVAGKKGSDLEAAIEAYDCETGGEPKVAEEGCTVLVMKMQSCNQPTPRDPNVGERPHGYIPVATTPESHYAQCDEPRVLTPNPANDARFKTPLTSMFKRSSSAPASYTRKYGDAVSDVRYVGRRDSFSVATPIGTPQLPCASPYTSGYESDPRVGHDVSVTCNAAATRGDNTNNLTPFPPMPQAFAQTAEYDCPTPCSQWTDTFSSSDGSSCSPGLPPFIPDLDDNMIPSVSPVSSAFNPQFDIERDLSAKLDDIVANGFSSPIYVPYSPYSPVNGWDEGEGIKAPFVGYHPISQPYVVTPQSPLDFDYDGIMKDAFEAASFVDFGGWNITLNSGHPSHHYGNAAHHDGLHRCIGSEDHY